MTKDIKSKPRIEVLPPDRDAKPPKAFGKAVRMEPKEPPKPLYEPFPPEIQEGLYRDMLRRGKKPGKT